MRGLFRCSENSLSFCDSNGYTVVSVYNYAGLLCCLLLTNIPAIIMADDNLTPWLTLVHSKGLGPSLLRKLLEGLGSIDAILGSSDSKLRQAGLPDKVIKAMRNVDNDDIKTDLDWLNDADDRSIITRESELYPSMLREIADPPLVLYARGDTDVLNTPQLAIVGSRKPGHSAENHAFDIARQLAGYGITVTSGLALGIDGCAHRGALAGGGYTVAVTATGLDRVYPAKHQQLAREIAAGSVIVSEFPIGTNPNAGHFPRRNRIISGLCYGTLVVEATLKSGTLTTAAHATSQAREVFAIPGNIDNPNSRGCHALLKKGATLVESVADILEPLAPMLASRIPAEPLPGPQPHPPNIPEKPARRESSATKLLEALGHDQMSLDELIERTGLDTTTVTNLTLDLELEGTIEKVAGGNFVRALA